MDIFKWLDDGSFVKSYIINDFRESEDSYYINLKAVFIDNSELHIKEYIEMFIENMLFTGKTKMEFY
jgi:hypothetical protein